MPAKLERQVNHIIASEMAMGKTREEAESIAWAHVKHPEKESKAEDKKEKKEEKK